MKVVSFSALLTGRLYPPRKYSWHSFLAESTPGPYCGRKEKYVDLTHLNLRIADKIASHRHEMIYADKYMQCKRFLSVNARRNRKAYEDNSAVDKHRELHEARRGSAELAFLT